MARTKTKGKTKLEFVAIERLDPAPWNYKKPATPEMMTKLVASIREDASAGVMAVREMGDRLEVIDGNHRLEALRVIGWKQVAVENFGTLSKARAVLVAQRRNFQWFDEDTLALAALFKNDVLKEFTLDQLEAFTPLSRAGLEQLVKLTDFDWTSMPGHANTDPVPKMFFTMTDEVKQNWAKWMELAERRIGDGASPQDAFELLLRLGVRMEEDANVPVE